MSNSKNNYNRLFITIGALIALIILPWWVSLIIGAIGLWKYTYYEYIVLGFLLDLLYGSNAVWQGHHIHPALFFTGLTLALFVALQLLKKKVRLQ